MRKAETLEPRVSLLPNLVLANNQWALYRQQSGCQNCPGTEHGPQENQGMSQQFTDATKEAVKTIEKVTYGIHVTKIVQLTTCGKFT